MTCPTCERISADIARIDAELAWLEAEYGKRRRARSVMNEQRESAIEMWREHAALRCPLGIEGWLPFPDGIAVRPAVIEVLSGSFYEVMQ